MILFLWTFFFKLLVRTHKIYNIHVKLQTNSACLSKTFSNFMLPESLIKTQAWINMLDQFHSSLCRKQFFCNQEKFRKTCENLMFKLNDSDNRKFLKGLNALLYSNIHSSEPHLEFSWTSTIESFCKNN